MKYKVLFVCIENSCRSQMAEGFMKKLGADTFDAWSAGSSPSGKINQTAVDVMREKGIDLKLQRSKSLADLPKVNWDCVVTMGCGDACACLTAKHRLDWNLPDPRNLPLEGFRKIRDEIKAKVVEFIHDVVRKTPQVPNLKGERNVFPIQQTNKQEEIS